MSSAADSQIGPVAHDGEPLGFSASPRPDIAGAAARIGHYVWVSARLFELTGQWATTSTDPVLAIHFAATSSRFAWQATEWRRRLPTLREIDDRVLIRPPSEFTEAALDRLAATAPQERLAALATVIGDLEVVYRSHAEAASPLRDGAILRSLTRIGTDLAELARPGVTSGTP